MENKETKKKSKLTGCLKWFGIGLLVIIVIGVIVPTEDKTTEPVATETTRTVVEPVKEEATEEVKEEAQPVNNPKINLDEFNQLTEGMAYTEVVEIIGGEGTLSSETNLANITTKMYTWEGESFASNANAMFQNDSLISKAQFGLK